MCYYSQISVDQKGIWAIIVNIQQPLFDSGQVFQIVFIFEPLGKEDKEKKNFIHRGHENPVHLHIFLPPKMKYSLKFSRDSDP